MAKRKTPVLVAKLIEQHWLKMLHIQELLRVKREVPVDQQASHIRENTERYWIGVAHGASAQLEEVLHMYGCYAGFQHIGLREFVEVDGVKHEIWPTVGPTHKDYTSWRVRYYVR